MSKHPRARSANLSELLCSGGAHFTRIHTICFRSLLMYPVHYVLHAPSGIADRVVQSTRAHLSYPHANVFTHAMICFF